MAAKRKISLFLILRLLGIALFIVILTRVNLKEIAEVLANVQITLFIYGIFFQILVLIFKGIRWHIINDGRLKKIHCIRSFGRFFESYAIGVITPGRIGELLKAGHEKTRNDKANAFIRVLSERGFDVGIFVFIAGLAFLFGNYINLNEYISVLIIAVSIIIIVVSFILLSSAKVLLYFQRLINRLPGKFSEITLTPKKYSLKQTSVIFFFSLLSNFSYFVSCYFLAQSVYMFINFVAASGGVAIAGLFNMLPVTIMGLGTRELTFLTLFDSFDQSNVLAFSATMLIVAQIGGGIISMILGQAFLLTDRKRIKKEIE